MNKDFIVIVCVSVSQTNKHSIQNYSTISHTLRGLGRLIYSTKIYAAEMISHRNILKIINFLFFYMQRFWRCSVIECCTWIYFKQFLSRVNQGKKYGFNRNRPRKKCKDFKWSNILTNWYFSIDMYIYMNIARMNIRKIFILQ